MRARKKVDERPDPDTFADNFLVTVLMRREKKLNLSWLLVEGRGDLQAMQQHCACQIKEAEGRDQVITTIRKAEEDQDKYHGIIGLVDKDYSDFIPEKKPLPRRVVMFKKQNDLESAVLFHQSINIVEQIIRVKEMRVDMQVHNVLDSWGFSKEYPFDNLVKNIVGPIGVLRVAYKSMPKEYRFGNQRSFTCGLGDDCIVQAAWSKQNPLKQLTPNELANIPDNNCIFNVSDRKRLENAIGERIPDLNRNPWSYVRGKDLVYTLALALSSNQYLIHKKYNEPYQLKDYIQNLIPSYFDAAVLSNCELKELVLYAIYPETNIYCYFHK